MISEKRTYWTLGVLLIAYILLRSILVPLVHDESATFFHYIQAGEFIPFFSHWDANNHILNSGLAIITFNLFGAEAWALRLPNLLALVLLLYAVWGIAGFIKNRWARWAFILPLLTSHYFIEFFGYARGYGLSMAFLLLAVYFLMKALAGGRIKYHVLAHLVMMFAVLSNLTLIYTELILASISAIHILFVIKPLRVRNLFGPIVLGILPAIGFVALLFVMKDKGLLYYGLEGTFWEVSVMTLLPLLLGESSSAGGIFLLVFLLVPVAALVIFLRKMGFTRSLTGAEMLPFWLLLVNLLAIITLHHFLGVNYPEDRVGLFLFPLTIGAVAFGLNFLITHFNKPALYIILLPFLFFPIHFAMSANFSYSTFWSDERIPQRFYDRYEEAVKRDETLPTIGGHHIRHLCWAWMNIHSDGLANNMQETQFESGNFEFLIATKEEVPAWNAQYDSLDFDAFSGLYLLRLKNPIQFENWKVRDIGTAEISSTDEFISLEEQDLSNMTGAVLNIQFALKMTAAQSPIKAWLVAAVEDASRNSLEYERIPLDWLRKDYNADGKPIKQALLLPSLTTEAAILKVYLWNMNRSQIQIDGGHIRIDTATVQKR